MPSPCSPECEPLYSRTIANASSAMARIALTSLSSRRLSTGRTCRQPTEACAYQVPRVPCFSNISVSRVGVFGEMLERHRAILDEGDRLSLLLHRHHDVEAGGAHVGDRRLQRRIEHLDHAAPLRAAACPSRSRDRPSARASCFSRRTFSSGRPRRTRPAAPRPARRARTARASGGTSAMSRASSIMVRSTSSTAIGAELDEVLRRVHRLVEAAEMAGADRALAEQRRELQLDLRGEAERAFRADQDMREVDARCGRAASASRL